MIYVGKYDELSPGKGYPSMRDFFSDGPYEGKDKIIKYLTNNTEDMVSAMIPKDVFTSESIPMESIGMNDGEYTWFTTLAYYVEKYNLKLPKEFEDKILSQYEEEIIDKVINCLKKRYKHEEHDSIIYFQNSRGEVFNVVMMDLWGCLVIEYNDTGEDGDLYYPNDYKDFDTMLKAMIEEIER